MDETSIASRQVDPELARKLAAEPPDQYYRRLFNEYVNAKRRLGDPVEGIQYEAFSERIQSTERELSTKYSSPVRHLLEVREGEIVLVAIPLG